VAPLEGLGRRKTGLRKQRSGCCGSNFGRAVTASRVGPVALFAGSHPKCWRDGSRAPDYRSTIGLRGLIASESRTSVAPASFERLAIEARLNGRKFVLPRQ
jgi:hypothetical protein